MVREHDHSFFDTVVRHRNAIILGIYTARSLHVACRSVDQVDGIRVHHRITIVTHSIRHTTLGVRLSTPHWQAN